MTQIKRSPATKEKTIKASGVPARKLIFPVISVLAILHFLIIVVILMVNSVSSQLSTIMRNSGIYTQDATSLLAGSSLLSETASNFILMPVTETGEPNINPLVAYAAELGEDHRGPDVVARFETYEVPSEARQLLSAASASAQSMLEAQLHAIALIRSVHPLPDIPQIAAIPDRPLSEEELAMTPQQREAEAHALILGTDYGMNKQAVSQNVNACAGVVQKASAEKAAEASRNLTILRTILWADTLTIIVILILTFAVLYREIIEPLLSFAKLIPEEQTLDETRGVQEVRLVASAYNDVHKRRDSLDNILRSAAETDALTNLPNRYRFEQFVLEAEESGYPVAMLLFDVNYLKQTNDKYGHLAGDKLLCTAAECIASCFGDNCFRFGGDEFAAIVTGVSKETVREMMRKFEETEKTKNVSISVGCAYTDEIGQTSFRDLLDEADRKMYQQKEKIHHGLNKNLELKNAEV